MKRRNLALFFILSLFISLWGNIPAQTATASKKAEPYNFSENQEITIYHTNDVHGGQGGGIGIAKLATLKKNTEASLLVDAGDATQGQTLATLTKGEDIIKLMNLAGYDAMAAGNHEFDYGQEQLLKNLSLANFPILGANVRKDGNAFLQGSYGDKESNGEYIVLQKAGVKIGIFGLTTQNTRTASNPAGLTGITFEDEIETAKRMIDKLEEENVDILICLAHLGNISGSSDCMTSDVAEAMTGEYVGKLDAIIDGHSHTEEKEVVNGVTISQTGSSLTKVGKLTFNYDSDNDEVRVQSTLLTADDLKDITPDEDITTELNKIQEQQNEITKERVADTENTLWGGYINNVAEGRVTELNLGDFIADSMIEAGDEIIHNGNVADKYRSLPIVAVENGGGIRSTLHRGTITKGDILNVLPFGNVVSFKAVTPKLLYEVLELGVSGNSGQNSETGLLTTNAQGGFLQVGGLKFTYDPNQPEGKRIKKLILDGETTSLSREDESREIILASNDYLIAGGNGYSMLKDLPTVAEGGALDVMLENTILERTNQGTKALTMPTTENRIVIESSYQPKAYTAYIEVRDEDEKPAANKIVSYSVDGSQTKTGETNANGLLPLTVSDGAHTVRIEQGLNEAYICNYTGTGILTTYTITYPGIRVNAAGLSPKPAVPTPTVTPSYTPAPTNAGNPKPTATTTPTPKPAAKKITVSKAKVLKAKRKANKVTITIKKVKGASGYKVKIASNKKMTKNCRIISTKRTKIIVTKWKKKNCYIKVRAYKLDSTKKKVYGQWSNRKKVS